MKHLKFSDQSDNIVPALFKALSRVSAVKANAKNPHLHNVYANLNAVCDAVEPALAEEGILLMQPCSVETLDGVDYVEVETIFLHESGQWAANIFRMPTMDKKPQTIGSVETYARRYALGGVCGLVTEKDDDGNAGSGVDAPRSTAGKQQTQKAQPAQSKPQPKAENQIASGSDQFTKLKAEILAIGVTEQQWKSFARGARKPAGLKPDDYLPHITELKRLISGSEAAIAEFDKDPEAYGVKVRQRVPSPHVLAALDELSAKSGWASGLVAYQKLMAFIGHEEPTDGDIIDFMTLVAHDKSVHTALKAEIDNGGTFIGFLTKIRNL